MHLAQGLLMLALSTAFALPVTAAFLSFDQATGTLEPDPQTLADVRIAPLVAGFLFLSAVAHLLVSAPRLHRWYETNLTRGINPARWLEYSLSASLMIVVIAMLVGIYDIASLILIFALNAAMIFFGWLMELHNQTTSRTGWTAYWLGCVVGIVPWIAIGIYLFGSTTGDTGPPTFVYVIYGSLFLFFNVFAVNMALQYKKVGPWRSYLYGERVYVLLSLGPRLAGVRGTLRPV